MGHRKVHAPKRGSLAFLPRGRASRWVGRIRHWPEVEEGPQLLAFAGFKAGMTYGIAVDNREGSLTFGKEIVIPLTILESPPMLACAIRAYTKTYEGMRTFGEAWIEKPSKDFERVISVPEKFMTEQGLKKIEDNLAKIADIRLLMATQPRLAKRGKKAPDLIEIKVGGKSIKDRFEYEEAAWIRGESGRLREGGPSCRHDRNYERQGNSRACEKMGNQAQNTQSKQNSPPSRINRRMDPPLCRVLGSTSRTNGISPANRIQQNCHQSRKQRKRSDAERRIHSLRAS